MNWLWCFALLNLANNILALYVEQCSTRYFEQPKDHFGFVKSPPTFKQRVLFNLKHFKRNGPIFFYFGNEANVELYVEHTGLMWENASKFGAAVVFAEHRGYGESQLCELEFFTTEQALHDFAVVIDQLKLEWRPQGVIGFGGSYGGMLATAFRFHYPHLTDGVIAGSAPVLAYEGMNPAYDSNGFAQIVTKDAGPTCAALVKSELKRLDKLSNQELALVAEKNFKICHTTASMDRKDLISWITSPWDYLAMGNFPYPSSYVQPRGGMLPAFPVRVACERMKKDGLAGVTEFFYNATKDQVCFNVFESTLFSARQIGGERSTQQGACAQGSWDYQYCTNHLMPFSSGTEKDMFFPFTGKFNAKLAEDECEKKFGVRPNRFWARQSYGGLSGLQSGLTNVVFSNGLLDPWTAGGVVDSKGFHPSVKIVLIPSGAHHMDLMFSHPLDLEDVKQARLLELDNIRTWIREAAKHSVLDDFSFSSLS